MQFLVYSCLQVLVEQRLEFLVLLVKEASFFNQVLALNKHLIVLAEGFIKGFPDAQLLVGENFSHLAPVHLLFALFSVGLLLLALEVALLFGLVCPLKLILNSPVFSRLVEAV